MRARWDMIFSQVAFSQEYHILIILFWHTLKVAYKGNIVYVKTLYTDVKTFNNNEHKKICQRTGINIQCICTFQRVVWSF